MSIKTYRKTLYLCNNDYRWFRHQTMRGMFTGEFETEIVDDEGGRNVTFITQKPSETCRQLEACIDFGASCAADILGFDHHR